ncbi:LacI family transcriptional regulator [Diaminobutyricimonas aerilata]|uniref:LacI family transcriptional regulator n=1 Tax=Diaminobutyricimonas aerilata TaxID=1162967 RepID=A0A2M9CHK5_9MICO|nr:LacI family DNA-binding transcriptional regulator [Diaminobutyricimonas aerilata]PJJ71352.1 LacI family transcriptional regulator [Diaminobutyricimonas aerilata]
MTTSEPTAPRNGRRRSSDPTVHDVAERAGVSPMTVSRVLSGGKNVRIEVQERVEKAVAELGYHRNENARSLRPGQRSGLVGVTITNIANPYYAEMLGGVEEVASEHSRRILVGNSNEDAELERQLVADFIGRRVEGLIVVPSGSGTADHLRPDRLGGVPIVLASRAAADVDADTVLIDDVNGARQATAALLAEGHRRIAFLGNRLSVFTGQRRLDGFRLAHQARGLTPIDELVRLGQQDVSSAEIAMTELLALPSPPTAVFSANNRNTIGAIRAIVNLQRRQLEQNPGTEPAASRLRLFGFDTFDFADMSPVQLSVVDHDARELGRRAAQMLFDRLENTSNSASPRVIELPVTLRQMP